MLTHTTRIWRPPSWPGLNTGNPLVSGLHAIITPDFAWVDGAVYPVAPYSADTTFGAIGSGKSANTAAVTAISGLVVQGVTPVLEVAAGCSAVVCGVGVSGGSGNAMWIGAGGANGFGYNSSGVPLVMASGGARVTHTKTPTANCPYVFSFGWKSSSSHTGYVGIDGDFVTAATTGTGTSVSLITVGHSTTAGFSHGANKFSLILIYKRLLVLDEARAVALNPQQVFARLNRHILFDNGAAAATATTLSGPSSGTTGVASSNFTVGANGTITGTVTVTPGDAGNGGTFSPTTVAISSGTPTATFTYTPASTGVKTISISDDGGLTDATPLSYTSNAAASGYAPALFTMRNPSGVNFFGAHR